MKKIINLFIAFSFILISLVSLSRCGKCLKGNCIDNKGIWKMCDSTIYKGSFKNMTFHGYGEISFKAGIYKGYIYKGY